MTSVSAVALAENALTAGFLADVGQVDTAAPAFARTHDWLGRPVFNRPALLDAGTVRGLGHDLGVFYDVLRSLPDRLFGGDHAALARALGLPEAQAVAVTAPGAATPLGRADLVHDGTGFRLVEFNTSSSLGGCEIAEMNRAMLADPAFAAFAAAHGLTHGDPVAGMMRAFPPSPHPIAVLTWQGDRYDHMRLFLARLAELGHDAVPGHLGQLAYRRGVLTLAGRPVDRVFRTFQLGRLDGSPAAQELAAPLLRAAADGAVTLVAPFAADLYGVKECLALLSEDAHRPSFGAAERAVIDRLLPWTRRLRADLVPDILDRRHDLVLKPSTGYAGRGITAGWLVDRDEWQQCVTAALATPHVVQERVHPVAERFVIGGEPVRCLLSWGAFLTPDGYGGAFVKGIPGGDQDIRYLGDGSHVGCVFHEGTTA